ncbi:MAG: O-antigen ligase family protein [Parvibaculaceae bacterium]
MDFAAQSSSLGRNAWAWCVLAFLLLVLIAGGTPRYGSYADVPLELVSLPIILVAVLRLAGRPAMPGMMAAFTLCAATLLLPLVQLIPLPPAIWTALPGRGFVVEAFAAARIDLTWMPLSLSPPATLRSFLSLFPALAVFLATLTLTHQERRTATLIIVAFGIASVVLGLAQIAGGPQSALRIYDVTNRGSAVGLFANRNHFAALLYCVMPLTAAWMIHLVQTQGLQKWAGVALAGVIYGSLILGLGISASRAGIALAMLAILASLLLAWRKREEETRNRVSKVVFIAGLAGIFAVLQFGLAGILSRLDKDPTEEGRLVIAQVTWRAATSVFPVGSGIGTFIPFYAMFETPAEIGGNYANHAHNDWLELWLEGGVPAALIAAAFLAWLGLRIGHSWKRENGLDWLLARAASISIVLLLLHSVVDYPLRTAALAAVFAFGCALILDLPQPKRRSSRRIRTGSSADADTREGSRIRTAGRSRTSLAGNEPADREEAQPIRPYSAKSGKFQ